MAYEQLGVNSCWRIDLNKQGTSQWSGELAAHTTTVVIFAEMAYRCVTPCLGKFLATQTFAVHAILF